MIQRETELRLGVRQAIATPSVFQYRPQRATSLWSELQHYLEGAGAAVIGFVIVWAALTYLSLPREVPVELVASISTQSEVFVGPPLLPEVRLVAEQSSATLDGDYISLDAFCLSMNVFFEARNQSTAGQVAVAQITMNRVRSALYPDDVCGVVHQFKQFSWYWDGKSDVPQEAEAWDRAQMVARGVLAGSGHANLMDENILYYHALYVNPRWNRGMQVTARIGDHIFYDGGP